MFSRKRHDTDTLHDERHTSAEHGHDNRRDDHVDRRDDPVDRGLHEERRGRRETVTPYGHEQAHERYGGMNAGADFFGWLVALATSALLTGIVGAVVAAVSEQTNVSQTDAEARAGTIGIVAAAVLVTVMAIGYFTGGYVAGRMSRFDGGRQGFGVWLIGLVVMLLAAGIGALAGTQYNVLDRVNLPTLPVAADDASLGALITGVVLLVVTLLAALAGGKVGRNYHRKVDAAHFG